MIDRHARDETANLLRRFLSGRISTVEFVWNTDDVAEETLDMGVLSVIRMTSEDTGFEHRDWNPFAKNPLRGRECLTAETRRQYLAAILFLWTDLEYAWPSPDPHDDIDTILMVAPTALAFGGMFALSTLPSLSVACFKTAASIYKYVRRQRAALVAEWHGMRDFSHWPFCHQDDFHAACRRPRLLAGNRL